MSIESLVLGAVSGVRPATSQAAVFALLRAPSAARSLLAFSVAGMVASVAVGMVVVLAFKGADDVFGGSTFTAVFDLIAGVAAIAFAAGIQYGRLPQRRERERPQGRATAAIAVRLRRPSTATAAAAGIATHVPGLIYLAALNSIAAGEPGPASAAVQVLLYNLLWFAIPLTAFTLAVRSPATARAYLDRGTAWAQRNQERLLVVLFAGLGVYLTAKGLAYLL